MICFTQNTDDIELFCDFPLVSKAAVPFYYKNTDDDGVYIQKNIEDKITALLSFFDGDCTFIPLNDACFPEIVSFLNFKGVYSVTTEDGGIFELLKGFNVSEYSLCKFSVGSKNPLKTDETVFLCDADNTDVYRDLFELLSPDGAKFSFWFCDVAKRFNSGFLDCVYIKKNGKPVSCAFSPSSFRENALISGVATKEEYRNNGFASACILKLTEKLLLNNGNIYLWCEKGLIPFYDKLGFKNISNIYVGRK